MHYTASDGFPYYFHLAKGESYTSLFSATDTHTFLRSISEEKATYRYAPDKWSIKQIIGHIIDHERIKIFRAFLMSRKQSVSLWGYDQNSLIDNSRFDELTLQQLYTDFVQVRNASISFIQSLSEQQLHIKGFAGPHEISLEDFLKSIIGHEKHHITSIKERYYRE